MAKSHFSSGRDGLSDGGHLSKKNRTTSRSKPYRRQGQQWAKGTAEARRHAGRGRQGLRLVMNVRRHDETCARCLWSTRCARREKRGAILVDHTTALPRLRARSTPRPGKRHRLLDAPVFGWPGRRGERPAPAHVRGEPAIRQGEPVMDTTPRCRVIGGPGRASSPNGQPICIGSASPRACRSVAFAKRTSSTSRKSLGHLQGARSPGRWRIGWKQMDELKAEGFASLRVDCART